MMALGWLGVLLAGGAYGVSPSHPRQLILAWASRLTTSTPELLFRISSQSLLAMFGRFLTSDGYGLNLLSLSKAAILTLAPVVEGLLFLVVILQRRGNGYNLTRVIAETSMLVVLMVLASPLAWMATYTALLLPVFLAVGQTYEMLRL